MDCEQILVVIPARGGSKGIPGKNIFPLAGEPLIVHSIRHALTSKLASRVIVSTDSENIAAVARENGAEVIERPAEISDDLASSEAALLHVLDQLREQENYTPDLVVFLQCTSPLRRNDDIDRAIETLKRQQADSLLSVSPSHRFLWTEQDGAAKAINYDPARRPRRQDMTPQYVENGSLYVFKSSILHRMNNRLGGKIALYKMDEAAMCDIDTPFDMKVADMLLREYKNDHQENQ